MLVNFLCRMLISTLGNPRGRVGSTLPPKPEVLTCHSTEISILPRSFPAKLGSNAPNVMLQLSSWSLSQSGQETGDGTQPQRLYIPAEPWLQGAR